MERAAAQHVIFWTFVVRPGKEADFETAYNPAGAWAQLFSVSSEFLGTELLRSGTVSRRYMTVDRWASAEAFQRFREAHGAEYRTLDAECAGLTETEDAFGVWTSVPA